VPFCTVGGRSISVSPIADFIFYGLGGQFQSPPFLPFFRILGFFLGLVGEQSRGRRGETDKQKIFCCSVALFGSILNR